MIKRLGLIKDYYDDEEEEKEKPGWSQRTGGIGELPKYEEPELGKLGSIGTGIKPLELEEDISKPPEIKKLGFIKEETTPIDKPLTLQMLYSINLNYSPASSEPIEKIKRYEIDIQKLEKEAEIRGSLKPELYSAYEQIIEKYNKAVKEYNIQGTSKWKQTFKEPQLEPKIPLPKNIIEGLPISKPEDKPKTLLERIGVKKPTSPEELKMGIDVAMGTWEEQKKANPELQETENLAYEIFKIPDKNERIAIIQEALTGTPKEEVLKDIQSNLQKYGSINPPKDWKKAFKEEGILKTAFIGPSEKYGQAESVLRGLEDIIFKKENPGLDYLSSFGMKGFLLLMGGQFTDTLLNAGFKVGPVKLNEKELTGVFRRAREALIPETGKFKSNLSDNDYAVMKQLNYFLKTTNKSPIAREMLEKIVKQTGGLTFPQQVNIFGAKLYAGLPADEIAKSWIATQQLTKEMIQSLDPVKVSQVAQQLLNTSPALASAFLRAVEKPEMPKVEKEETISGLSKPDENLLKKIDQGLPIDLKAEVEAGANLSTISKLLKRTEDKIINAKVNSLKADIEGKAEAGLFGAKATAKWVVDFKRAFGKDPTEAQLKEIAVEQLTEGYKEAGGEVAPDEKFVKLDNALKQIQTAQKPEDRTLDMFAVEKPEGVKEVVKGKEPEPFKIEFAPKYIKEYINILQENPDEHNKAIVLDSIKKYLEGSKNAYIEYKNKMGDFPELHLEDWVAEYDKIQAFYNEAIKPEPAKVTPPVELKEELKAEVKEPWEIRKDEFLGEILKKETVERGDTLEGLKVRKEGRIEFHKQLVQQALAEGKPVPPEVLADYPELKAEPGSPGEKFVGKAFRTETRIPEHGADIISKMKTAQEKLNYDASTTGNPIFKEAGKLAEKLGIDLNKVPIGEMAWVARDFKTAEKYNGAEEFKFPEDTIILARDDEGGFLILKNVDKYKAITEKPAVVEAPATKEDFNALDTTDKNKELFFEKYNQVYTETKKAYEKLIDNTVADLKEEGFKGVDKGGLKKDQEGYITGTFPTASRNPKWYRDFYERNNKAPTNKDLREIAIKHLSQGHTEDYGVEPANPIFTKLEAQLESYDTILSDIKSGDYSFETPRNIGKLNDKLNELEKSNKKLIKDYEAELTTLKADRASKYQELRKEAEAREKEEIKIGIKKGVEKVTKGKKLEGLSSEEIKKGNYLMGQINKIAHERGLTDKALTEIKRKYGYSPHLATATKRMSIPQLEAVLKAVNRARPKRIGYQHVITPKTERKIQSLKDNLMDKFQMSEKVYQETLKDLHIHKEPKYIDAKNFITEEQGKDLIYRLIDEANILRVTEPLRIALEKNPETKKLADALDRRVKSEGERTLKDPSDLNSVRNYFQILETRSGAPFFSLYQDLIDTHLENRAELGRLTKELNEYRDIIKDEKELKKTEDWILAKSNLEGRPETPENITPEEIKLAKKIEGILKDYQLTARTEKFLDNLRHPEDMPQYIQYKKEIDKAKDIYESKGYDDLVEYMKTQEWGIIRSGYDPMQVVSPKIRIYKEKALSLSFGKEHIEVRKDIEYKEQDTNIITRLLAYKRGMDNLSTMSPKIKALVTLANKNLDKFKDPHRVKTNLQVFFRELKGYDRSTNWFERGINRLYSQAMITIIMGSPALSFRNLGQNFALGHDKAMLIDPRNKKLTPDDMDYLDTYVQQAEFMQVDWFMTGEKPLPGLALLTKIIKKVNLYPRSDIANRHLGFWGKINQVRMAFGDRDIDLKKKTEKAKFSDFSLLEQKRALQILAKDGEDAMARYVSRVYVDDVHFIYERAQRSLAEMGPYGKVFGNLMLFPRAYWEKLAKHSKKMTGKNVPFSERARAFKVISSIIIGGMLVSASYKKITGRQRSPYDPLELLAYEPGGLMLSTVGTVSEVYINFIMATKGDEKALADLTTSLPNLADMFIPFYNYTLRGLEAFVVDEEGKGGKNIDRLALRKLRMLIDREYAIRGGAYLLERNSLEKWQYFLSGAGVDVAIAEREKKEKEAKPIKIGKEIPRLGIPTISKPGIKRLSIIKKF